MNWSLIFTDTIQVKSRMDEKSKNNELCLIIFIRVKKPIDGRKDPLAHITFLPDPWMRRWGKKSIWNSKYLCHHSPLGPHLGRCCRIWRGIMKEEKIIEHGLLTRIWRRNLGYFHNVISEQQTKLFNYIAQIHTFEIIFWCLTILFLILENDAL